MCGCKARGVVVVAPQLPCSMVENRVGKYLYNGYIVECLHYAGVGKCACLMAGGERVASPRIV